MKDRLLIAGLCLLVESKATCISWVASKCQDCTGGGAQLQGNQCIVAGMWYSCYPDTEACCNGNESHSELGWDESAVGTCIQLSSNTGPSDPAPNEPWWEPSRHQVPTPNPNLPRDWNNWPMIPLPPPVTSGCAAYVSTTPGVTNSACKEFCEDDNKSNLEGFCNYEYWGNTDGWTRFTADGCFDNWIHGYSDEGNYGSGRTDLGGTTVGVTNTPQECQELCQRDATCVRFAWRARSQPGGAVLPVGNCQLKTQAVLTESQAIAFPANQNHQFVPAAEDTKWDWCNMGMNWQCWEAGFTCMACSGNPVCVWISANHVAGPKYCIEPRKECAATTSPSSTPFPGPATPEPTLPGPATPKPTSPGPATPKPTSPGPATPDSTSPGPATLKPTSPGPATSKPTSPGPATPEPTSPGPATPKPTSPGPATPNQTEGPDVTLTAESPEETGETVSTKPIDETSPTDPTPSATGGCSCGGHGCNNNGGCQMCPCAAIVLRVRELPKFLNLVVKN